MKSRPSILLLLAAAQLWPACRSSPGGAGVLPPASEIESRKITVDQLPPVFDDSRTYHYRVPNLQNPEMLLRFLLDAGYEVTRAWQPLDNPICADPIGATFTVELERDNPRILSAGFDRGAGRLFCATELIEFTVTAAGSRVPQPIRPVRQEISRGSESHDSILQAMLAKLRPGSGLRDSGHRQNGRRFSSS